MTSHRWLPLVAVVALVLGACAPAAQQSPDAGTPAAGTPPAGTPAAESPAAESPDTGTPPAESPDTGTPPAESPAATGTPAGSPTTGGPQQGGTLVFAGSRLAASLDPALTSDGESFRILQQIYEPLVDLTEGSVSEIEGVLAESWTGEPEDTAYTFTLRQGVTFHDGTPFNAEAVKFNFDRWDNFAAEFQPNAYYYSAVMGGFGEENLITSVDVVDEYTVTINLREPKADFIQGIALTPFSMVSPAVLQELSADDPATSTFGTDISMGGTGPFMWESYTPDQDATLARNENYWGDPSEGPFLDRVIIQAIPNPSARLQALQAPGGVMGIDLVAPTEYDIVENDPNLQLVERLSYNTLYLALNPTSRENSPLQELAVRQAVAHAIDKAALIEPFYGGRGEVADIFVPPSSETWHDVLSQDVPVYEFNPDGARQLLADAGFGPDNPPTVEFWYPTEVTRPYMPDPQGIGEAVITMLEAVGFVVTPNSSIWGTEYIPAATGEGAYELHFLGWTGDYDDPWNWYGYHFDLQDGEPPVQFNCDPEGLREAFATANSSFDEESRGQAFNEVVRIIHENVCFVTLVHGDTALAFQPEVQGYVPAPTGSESFKGVWLGEAGEEPAATEAPATEAPATEAPATEAPATEAPASPDEGTPGTSPEASPSPTG
jgi:peptide/nickel transport system substrate-binding protein